MCGIAGIFDYRERRDVDEAVLRRMTSSLAHRGPDGEGIHLEPGLGLGHRRLSIIDLAGGAQPMASADGNVVLTYNGEIYNFRELRVELESLGVCFRTHSDTEVIVHAWQAWGEACVERFNGMFAFALWDRPSRTLFMARDRLGIKPLYYACLPDGHLIFGSELKALLQMPRLEPRLSPPAVEDYFTLGYVPDPRTIFQSVYKLAPGHTLTLTHGEREPRIRPYWDLEFAPRASDEAAASEALIEHLRGAVDARLVSDVPLGAFLSGGVDSSAIVAMMAGLTKDPVTTCSVSFTDRRFDESQYARIVAERYHTRHFEDTVDADGARTLFDTLVRSYDEPFADSSALPTFEVCRRARRHVTVALSGDGGDEGFGGYRRHRWSVYEARMRSLLPQGLRQPVFATLGRIYPKLDWAPQVLRAKTTFQALGREIVESYLNTVSISFPATRAALFSESFKRDLAGYRSLDLFEAHARGRTDSDPLSLIQYLDYKTYLPGDILTKVDRASMAHGLEVRVPMLDHRFVEWAAHVSPALKLRGREGKYVLKKSLQDYLPREVMYRSKMGFSVPLADWFRGPLYEKARAALEERLPETGLFQRETLSSMLDQHRRGTVNHASILWALTMFDEFIQCSLGESILGNGSMLARANAC